MSKPNLMPLAQRERGAMLDLLRDLDEAQWSAPSLCARWSVRDVAVHVVSYDELGKAGLAAMLVRGGLRIDSVNNKAMSRYADLDPSEVVALVARCRRPRGLTAGFGGGIALTDATIHHQDIRRALERPRTILDEQLHHVLDFAITAPTLPARKNARGLRLVATDLDWTHGSGPEVTGPAEALLMSVAGRPHAFAELAGDGIPTLEARVRRN